MIIGGGAGVHQFVRIGQHAFIGGMSAIENDVIPYGMAIGNRAHLAGLNIIGLRRRGFTREQIHDIRRAYRLLFADEGTLPSGSRTSRKSSRRTPSCTRSSTSSARARTARSARRGIRSARRDGEGPVAILAGSGRLPRAARRASRERRAGTTGSSPSAASSSPDPPAGRCGGRPPRHQGDHGDARCLAAVLVTLVGAVSRPGFGAARRLLARAQPAGGEGRRSRAATTSCCAAPSGCWRITGTRWSARMSSRPTSWSLADCGARRPGDEDRRRLRSASISSIRSPPSTSARPPSWRAAGSRDRRPRGNRPHAAPGPPAARRPLRLRRARRAACS